MYFFDLEDYNCNEIPADWYDYSTGYRQLIDSYAKCFFTSIKMKLETSPYELREQLTDLSDLLSDAIDDVSIKLEDLIDALAAHPSPVFDYSYYTNFINSFNYVSKLNDDINLLLASNGENVIGYESNVGVDTQQIQLTGLTNTVKIKQCTGVYMKQYDYGSEFIGTVEVMGGSLTTGEGGVTTATSQGLATPNGIFIRG